MRKINNTTLFLYGVVITCSVFLIAALIPGGGIFKLIYLTISGICVGNIIGTLAWGEKP
jgi:hypothetical protein